jgi:hypothetical protein
MEADSSEFFGFIDDTGYDKITYFNKTGGVFAGDIELMDAWKEWFKAGANMHDELPVTEDEAGIAVCMVNLEQGSIDFKGKDLEVDHDECYVAGTGALPAFECWAVHYDARKAVETALTMDMYSGGKVKYLNGNLENNLGSANKAAVKEKFLDEGSIMYIKSGQIVPLKTAMENDSRVQSLVDKIAKGKIRAQARMGTRASVWTTEERKRLNDALAKVVARNQLV